MRSLDVEKSLNRIFLNAARPEEGCWQKKFIIAWRELSQSIIGQFSKSSIAIDGWEEEPPMTRRISTASPVTTEDSFSSKIRRSRVGKHLCHRYNVPNAWLNENVKFIVRASLPMFELAFEELEDPEKHGYCTLNSSLTITCFFF